MKTSSQPKVSSPRSQSRPTSQATDTNAAAGRRVTFCWICPHCMVVFCRPSWFQQMLHGCFSHLPVFCPEALAECEGCPSPPGSPVSGHHQSHFTGEQMGLWEAEWPTWPQNRHPVSTPTLWLTQQQPCLSRGRPQTLTSPDNETAPLTAV